MTARPVTHPSAETLQALGLGKMTDTLLADTVLQHLETCAECRAKIAGSSGESFVNQLREARRNAESPIPTREISDIGRAMKAVEQVSTTPPEVLDLPPELRNHPQYEVLRELGRGGMGVVYLAKNQLMDRLEVLKVVNKALLDRPGMLERFLREIRSAAKLNHPNIVTAYNAMQLGELLVFAMEYVAGEDLAHVVKNYGGPLPVLNASYYVQQVLLGLQHAHEKGMVHRDIKPQNLILAKEDKKHTVKILDFGLAKARSERGSQNELTGSGQMLGTPDYIAPEQSLDAASADIRADIYSLGCTYYYLLAGRAPFKGRSLFEILQAHQSQIAKPLHEERPDVSPALSAVVAKMLAKAPEERYQTPIEVAQAIRPFLKADKKGPSTTVTPARPAPAAEEKVQPHGLVEPIADAMRRETLSQDAVTVDEPRKRPPPKPRMTKSAKPATLNRKWLFAGAGLAAAVLIALVAWWVGSGVRVQTKDGVIVLNDLPQEADVLVDGDKVTVTWDKDGKKAEIRIKPGTHKIVAIFNGKTTVIGEEIQIASGGSKALTVRVEELKKTPDIQVAKPERPKPDNFGSFFNGKDLTGWYGLEGYWYVADGTIVGRPPPGKPVHTFLISDKTYRNFDLKFQVKRPDGAGNSGVQFRSQVNDRVKCTVIGPQCEIYSANFTYPPGSLVTEPNLKLFAIKARPEVASKYKDADWNDFHIRCLGKHVLIEVNGVTAIDGNYPELPDEGVIAWQIHGSKTAREILFRNLEFMELGGASQLPATKPTTPGVPRRDEEKPKLDRKARIGSGSWKVQDSVLLQADAASANCCMLFGDQTWTDYDYSFDVVKTNGQFGICAIFRASNLKNFMLFDLAGWQNRKYGVECFVDGKQGWITNARAGSMAKDKKYHVLGSVVNNLANEPRPAKLGIAFSVLPGLRGR